MEEQIENIIRKISTSKDYPSCDEHFLDKYFSFFDLNESLNNIWIIDEFLKKEYDFQNTDDEVEKFITTILKVNNKTHKIKLIPLLVYIDGNRKSVLLKYLLDYGFWDFLKNNDDYFIEFFKKYHLHINLQDSQKHSYRFILYQSYQNGLDTKDFTKIYDFIDGYFVGYNAYWALQNISFIAYTAYIYFRIYKNNFMQILDKQCDIFQIKSFIFRCDIDELLFIAKESSNQLVKFEIIKNLLYRNSDDLKLKDRNDIDDILLSFTKDKQIWNNFLKFYLQFPQNNPVLISYLTHIFDKDDLQKYVKDTFVENITIDKYGNLENDKILTSCILNIKNINNKKYILQAIFNKWSEYIKQSADYILNITTFINITPLICYYIGNFLDKRFIENQIQNFIKEMQEIDNIWFADSLTQHKYFLKLLYQFFVYSAYLNNENSDKKIEDLLQLNRFRTIRISLDAVKLHFDNIVTSFKVTKI